ncbi:MAG: galactose-1-phosphate uridylyltransferase, partial [Ignavibacteria bacterium]|nr:galactose-1-phosphate uridylyltransferase [Ignavibacteria bacterium]
VFDNDFSALDFNSAAEGNNRGNELLTAKSEKGICRVVCFSPIHNLSLGEMSVDEIKLVVDTWCDEYKNLGSKEEINYIQIFENKGEMMGCSNPHPHCQIWATQSIPNEPLKETVNQKKYFIENRSCLLCDYLKLETQLRERLIFDNDEFALLVPFWAIWPFETMIISKQHLTSLNDFNEIIKHSFAEILKKTISNYDKLFDVSFPYSAGIHQAPTDNEKHNEWHFHFHFYPPLLRSATIKKFLVGYEMLAEPQRDLTPEESAQKLKSIFQNEVS